MSSLKTYLGCRTADGAGFVVRVYPDGTRYLLAKKEDLAIFEWGYGGSGPAALALALLLDATGDGDEEWALEHSEAFKELVVAEMPETWSCTQQQILDWVEPEKRRDGWGRGCVNDI